MLNYKFTHGLPSIPRQHLRKSLPIMKVTAGALQIVYEPTVLGRLRPKHKEGITTSRQQCCEPRSAGKMKSMVPSRNASLAPGAAHHLIGDIPVAMHILRNVRPALCPQR